MHHHELQNILSGISSQKPGNLIQAVAQKLGSGKKAGGTFEKDRITKQQEEEILITFAESHQLWKNDINENTFLAEGAEQKVYLCPDGRNVIKLNDAIFYTTWADYFLSLQLHNYFFPGTLYTLIGFTKKEGVLYAVVQQPYIEFNAITNMEHVKTFLHNNGFLWKKNFDYYHPGYGIILEDLHDENVLTSHNTLFFIDTVFYLQTRIINT
jgi:Serine/Threonine/Tyrosine Kinase found in polyvalent proteins